MKTKYIFTLIAFILITNIYAQNNLNDYKYVIVPRKYNFLKEVDKYQLNSLTKFLLEKENFKVFFHDDIFPEDLAKNRCLGLKANVLDDSSIFKTKLTIEIRDCNDRVLFTSKEGVSRDKNYKKAYHEALRQAFQSLKGLNYEYHSKQIQKTVEVKPLSKPETGKAVIKKAPRTEEVKKQPKQKPIVKSISTLNILYAQATGNGFQVVDSTPKVVMILISTPKQNVYIVKGEDAIVYEQDGFWYKSDNANSSEVLNIKF